MGPAGGRAIYSLTNAVLYVLILFMPDALAAPLPAAQLSRSGRLLVLVRKLIEHGKEFTTTVRKQAFTDPRSLRSAFGTADIAQILASVARALHRADALEARIVRNAARIDAGSRPPGTSAPRRPRAVPAAMTPTVEAKPPIARLPTPSRIVAEVHGQRIGAVLADICRDLGLLPCIPPWQEVWFTVDDHGGSSLRMWRETANRALRPILEDWPPGFTLTWPEDPSSPSSPGGSKHPP